MYLISHKRRECFFFFVMSFVFFRISNFPKKTRKKNGCDDPPMEEIGALFKMIVAVYLIREELLVYYNTTTYAKRGGR